jgi:hypothetical protein
VSTITFDRNTRVVNRRVELETKYIGRGSDWGNPFTSIKGRDTKAEFVVGTRDQSVSAYREYLLRSPVLLHRLLELNGHKLGCFCKPQSCHGDILRWALRGMIKMYQVRAVPDGFFDWKDQTNVEDLVSFADSEERRGLHIGTDCGL